MNDGQRYDRTETEWAELEAAGRDFLVSRARKPDPITTYTELNAVLAHRTGQPPWNLIFRQTVRRWANCWVGSRTVASRKQRTVPMAV